MDRKPEKHITDSPLFWSSIIVGLAITVALVWLIDLKWLHREAQRLNGAVVFSMTAILPLFGFPAGLLYAICGAKFGHFWGMALTAGAISLHLLGSWWIGRGWLRAPLESVLKKLRVRKPEVPEGEHVAVCLLVALIPGISYTIKNYLLVLANIPFRKFFWSCLPAHLFTASVGVLFGDFTGSMSNRKIAFLIAYAVLLSFLSRHVVRGIKQRSASRAKLP